MGDKTQARRTRSASRSASKTPRAAPSEQKGLTAAQELEPFRALLRTLAGRSPDDFSARLAVLQVLTEGQGPVFTSRDLQERLPSLSGKARSSALRVLLHGGWLEAHPTGGLVLTEAGWRAYGALQLLRRNEELTSEEMTAALRRKSLGELASAGRDALLPALLPLPLPATDQVLQAAESRLLRRSGRF